MIRFNGVTKDGRVNVTVTDYYRKDLKGYTFNFRDIREGERLLEYFEGIMNNFWFYTGKNMRRYDG